MSLTNNATLLQPKAINSPLGARGAVRSRPKSSFLVLVWIALALGVIVVIEPSPGDIAIAFLVVAGIFFGHLSWSRSLLLPSMLLGFFMLSNLASLCYAIDFNQGGLFLSVTLFMVVSWLFAVGVLSRYGELGLHTLMSGYTFGGVASALLAVLAYFHLIPFGENLLYFDRLKGFFKDPNVFGPYLVLAALYAVQRLMNRCSAGQKVLWLGASLVSTVGMFLCFSRAAWANYAITLFAFFALNTFANRREGMLRRHLTYFFIVILLVSATLAYAMTIPQVKEVIAYRTELQAYDEDRFATHDAALTLGLENPLGVGPGQSFLYLDYATHSLYLRIFSENGVIGFLSFIAFVLLTLLRALVLSQNCLNRFQRSMFALVAAAIVGTLLNSFAIDTLHWRHFWFLLAVGWMPLWANSPGTTPGTTQKKLKQSGRQMLFHQVIQQRQARRSHV